MAVALSLVVCMAGLILGLWERLPDQIPVRFSDGHPAAWIVREALFALPALGALLTGGCLLAAVWVRRKARERLARPAEAALGALAAHLTLMTTVVLLYLIGTARSGAPAAGMPVALGACAFLLLTTSGTFIFLGRMTAPR